MRISDWSSDVCSSDLIFPANNFGHFHPMPRQPLKHAGLLGDASPQKGVAAGMFNTHGKVATTVDRKSVVWGKSVSVRVDLGGRRIIKKKKMKRVGEQ